MYREEERRVGREGEGRTWRVRREGEGRTVEGGEGR